MTIEILRVSKQQITTVVPLWRDWDKYNTYLLRSNPTLSIISFPDFINFLVNEYVVPTKENVREKIVITDKKVYQVKQQLPTHSEEVGVIYGDNLELHVYRVREIISDLKNQSDWLLTKVSSRKIKDARKISQAFTERIYYKLRNKNVRESFQYLWRVFVINICMLNLKSIIYSMEFGKNQYPIFFVPKIGQEFELAATREEIDFKLILDLRGSDQILGQKVPIIGTFSEETVSKILEFKQKRTVDIYKEAESRGYPFPQISLIDSLEEYLFKLEEVNGLFLNGMELTSKLYEEIGVNNLIDFDVKNIVKFLNKI